MSDSGLNDLKLNREFFLAFARLIKEKSGLFFDLSKLYFLETRIKKRMAERGIKDFFSYLNLLESDYTDREFMELLNEITVHETSFFRITPHFNAFSDLVLPELIAKKGELSLPFLSFLSAGCSTGEEAYSIAIEVFEKMKFLPYRFDFSVVGVDISFAVIEKAREGLYKKREVSSIPDSILDKYFIEEGDSYRVKDFVREKVVFKYANLHNESDIKSIGSFDVVFCRYVLIYLDEMARKKVVENIFSILNPGGFLFVAPSESYNVSQKFAKISYKDSIVYMKPL